MIPETTIDAVRARTDLVALVGRFVPLKKVGTEFKGCCPFHTEKSPSFTVNAERWHCFGCGTHGDAIRFLTMHKSIPFPDAVKELAGPLGIQVEENARPRKLDREDYEYRDPDPTPAPAPEPQEPPRRKRPRDDDEEAFDWNPCVAAFTPADAQKLAEWRGYSLEFVEWMHQERIVGLFQGKVAIAVHDEEGKVVRCHWRREDGNWQYHPRGGDTAPLIVGDIHDAGYTLAFESQWDAFAVLDSLGYHEDPRGYAAVITRGATSNTDFSKIDAPTIIAIPQNDPEEKRNKKTLRTPAEEWLERIRDTRHKSSRVLVGRIPAEFKDPNDWIRDGKATPLQVRRRLIEVARSPMLQDSWDVGELVRHQLETKDVGDPSSLIGYDRRWLGKGTSFIITGPGGIGKSTLIMSMAAHWAAGASWHGIRPRRALKVLIVQAENDKGDLAEMFYGAAPAIKKEMGMSAQNALAVNLIFHRESGRTGEKFAIWLEEMITESGVDLVIIDPLLSYVGGDLAKQEVASQFFRQWMDPILHRTGVIMGFVHHTGKTSADSKSRKDWVLTDFQYIGMGSSELSNWPRATAAILPVPGHTGKFRFMLTKRGNRAGMTSRFSAACVSEIFLEHGKETLSGDECEDPDKDAKEAKKAPSVANYKDPASFLKHLPDSFNYKEAVAAFVEGCAQTQVQAKRTIHILTQGGHITRAPGGQFSKAEVQLFGDKT